MNEQELAARIAQMEEKLEAVHASVEKIRKYFLWTVIGSAALFILPLIGLLFAIPQFLSVYSNVGGM